MLTQDEATYIKGQGLTYDMRISQAEERLKALQAELAGLELEIVRLRELRDIYQLKLLPEMEAYEAVHGKISLGEPALVEEPISG